MAQTFPDKLGRYQIVKHLANGGMAQVLVARATGIEGFERHVVVKRIHADRAEDPAFVKMFLDEARLAASLHHNNIVQVHDIGKENGEYFFAMEYVHGEDLRRLLTMVNKRQQQVPLEHVVSIVTTAAAALHHAHEQRGPDRKPLGLVHRDVSPANIIVGYDGNLKVVDFGIAKAALRTSADSTKAGSLKGKVSYMAPEQCAGKAIDRRSDVYALGIVLYELTTVRRLFKGGNDFLTMSAIVQGNIPRPSTHRPDLPPDLEQIILKALALDPADRYQSADELREALEQLAIALSLRTSTSGLASYMKQVFGYRPEPWLVDEEPQIEISTDFDGSASGVAQPPAEASDPLAAPRDIAWRASAPIMRARTKAITDRPIANGAASPVVAAKLPLPEVARAIPPVPRLGKPPPPALGSAATAPAATAPAPAPATVPTIQPPAIDDDFDDPPVSPLLPEPVTATATPATALVPARPVLPDRPPAPAAAAAAKDDTGWGHEKSSATSSGTPLAWATEGEAAATPARRRKLFAVGGAGAALLLVIVVVARSGGGPDHDRSPAAAPAAEIEPAARTIEPPPPPAEPPAAPPAERAAEPPAGVAPPPLEPAAIEPPPVAVEPVAEPEAATAGEAGEGSAVKQRRPRKKKPVWNPDELFID